MCDLSGQDRPAFAQLMERLAQGSSEAAEAVIELYCSNILRRVRRSLPKAIRSKVDSIDIFQSVWASLLAKPARLAQLDTPQRFIAYLASAAQNKVLEKYRHFTRMQAYDVHREQRLSDPIGTCRSANNYIAAKATIADTREPTPSTLAEAREAWRRLLSACDERDQQVVSLRLSGMTHAEIAKQLNVTTRTIRRSLHKLLEAISQ